MVAETRTIYPEVELWTCDEHRLGLLPCLRRVWAPKGERPIVKVQHTYEWLYLYAFVQPQTGKTIWYILPELNTIAFQLVLNNFAKAVSASTDKHILLMLDQAPWHTAKALELPEGIEPVLQPAYSPELQPAERLWLLSAETLCNQSFPSLDQLQDTRSKQCALLIEHPQRVKAHTLYHWWPIIL